jgi:hypothetical protein
MSYTVKVTAVRPAGTDWYSDANPAGHEAWQNWFKNLPGVVSVKKTKPDANTIVRTYEFVNEAAYVNVRQESLNNAQNLARTGYNELHGIVSTTEVIGG